MTNALTGSAGLQQNLPMPALPQNLTLRDQTPAAARKAATEFESTFLAQMLRQMMSGIGTDGIMGGGQAEKIYRDMMVDEMGKSIAQGGGIGIADQLYAEMIKQQEVGSDGQSTSDD